ncbi:hypothetical protein N7490_010679 [Penicillium lividum]|nr:hypothetical protein N7490_010679 [Penicillium lividum]
MATSTQYLAIGMSNGHIFLYDSTTYQEHDVVRQKGAVLSLKFGESGNYLASAGAKFVYVWSLNSWSIICTLPISALCISMTFMENDCFLLAALRNNQLVYWDIQNGGIAQEEPTNWTQDFEKRNYQYRQPTGAAFCPHQKLLAVMYRGEDLILWDFELERMHDIYEKETGSHLNESSKGADGSTTVWALVFSPAIDANILAAAYSDGDLMIYDTSSGSVRGALRDVNAHALACSPDGRTLATADSQGTIRLYDMESLKMIYRLNFSGDQSGSESLAFSLDNSRLLDVRAHQCRTWDPVVLQRQEIEEINSDTASVSTNPQEIDYRISETVKITSIICIPSASIVFYGKEDGSVHVYDIAFEVDSQQLFVQTPGISITLLYFDDGILTCADSGSHVASRRLTRRSGSSWNVQKPFLDIRIGTSIQQVLTCSNHSRLLVCTESEDILWDLVHSKDKAPLIRNEVNGKRHWIQNPTQPNILLLVTHTGIMSYDWTSLKSLTKAPLDNLPQCSSLIDRVMPLNHPRFFATTTKNSSLSQFSELQIDVWDFRNFSSDKVIQSPVHSFDTESSKFEAIIGALDERLIYLDTDHWVCSFNLGSLEQPAVRHFFFPNDWMGFSGQLLLGLGRAGEIIFAKANELVVIKRGLEFTDTGSFSGFRKASLTIRPSEA